MTIVAFLDMRATRGKNDRSARRKIRLKSEGVNSRGSKTEIIIHDISATGMLFEGSKDLSVGEKIAVGLPHSGECCAEVVWISERLCGCRFASPISAATLSAAQLQSVAHLEPAAATGNSFAESESFGARLLRLRVSKGFTQAEVAGLMGVSEPSVSAWEQNKSRPKVGRIDRLAMILGVSASQIMGQDNNKSLEIAMWRSKKEIAYKAGVSPESIIILIDYKR